MEPQNPSDCFRQEINSMERLLLEQLKRLITLRDDTLKTGRGKDGTAQYEAGRVVRVWAGRAIKLNQDFVGHIRRHLIEMP